MAIALIKNHSRECDTPLNHHLECITLSEKRKGEINAEIHTTKITTYTTSIKST